MDKAFEVQRQVRDNVKTFQTYMTDLQNWEAEMKRKEAALNGVLEQDLPPVRSKLKKEKPILVRKKPEKRISAFDYKSWDKFDVDKACKDVDMEEVGPLSLDGKKSQQSKLEKLREEAQHEKERGNTFVKQEKWDDAISCYSRAIELVKDDAIYYANRGLCYLKKDSLHQAENDCTEALRLDPTYVKALQRRATARERLGSLRAASHDLNEVITLEPHNNAARKQLDAIKARMGTKGSKSKSSPSTTPTVEFKPFAKSKAQPKIVELPDSPPIVPPRPRGTLRVTPRAAEDKWRDGVAENVTVIKIVKKPPHLRSKRPLKHIPIQEVLLGKSAPEKPPTRLKIIELADSGQGDSNNNDSNKIEENKHFKVHTPTADTITKATPPSPESVKLITDTTAKEKRSALTPPTSSVQFMAAWKNLCPEDRTHYLSIINPSRLPAIFANALESDTFSSVIRSLHAAPRRLPVHQYLRNMCKVKRFSALAMFLTPDDKKLLTDLLNHCKTVEHVTDNEIEDLKNKYEI